MAEEDDMMLRRERVFTYATPPTYGRQNAAGGREKESAGRGDGDRSLKVEVESCRLPPARNRSRMEWASETNHIIWFD